MRDAGRGASRARARRRVARRADLVGARGARRDGEARLARSSRPVLDAGLRRLRDRRWPRRASFRRGAGRPRVPEDEARAGCARLGTCRGCSARDLLPARASAPASASSGGSTSRSTGTSATTRSRSGYSLRHGFHRERMRPGHPTTGSSTPSRAGRLPRVGAGSTAHAALALRSAPLRPAGAAASGCATSAPALVLANVQSLQAVPFLVAARRLGLPVVGYVASWDHTVGKGVVSPHVDRYVVQNDVMRGRPRPLPRHPAERVVVTGWPQTDVFHERALARGVRRDRRGSASTPRGPSCSSWGTRRRTRRTRGASSSGSSAGGRRARGPRVLAPLPSPSARPRVARAVRRGARRRRTSPSRSRATPTSRRSRRCSSTCDCVVANAGTILLDGARERPARRSASSTTRARRPARAGR